MIAALIRWLFKPEDKAYSVGGFTYPTGVRMQAELRANGIRMSEDVQQWTVSVPFGKKKIADRIASRHGVKLHTFRG